MDRVGGGWLVGVCVSPPGTHQLRQTKKRGEIVTLKIEKRLKILKFMAIYKLKKLKKLHLD